MRASSHSSRQWLGFGIAIGLMCGLGAFSAAQGQTQTQTGQGQQTGRPSQGQGQQGQGQQGQGQRGQGQGAGQTQGQGQPRDSTAQPVGTATVSGAVLSDDAGRPVRNVRVAMTGSTLRAGKSATTDDQGRFSFTDLPAGQFTLTASKAGFVTVVYGQKKPNRPGTPVQIVDGQNIQNLTMRIPRGGVITGRVLDEVGDPTTGTQVRVMRYDMRSGVKQLVQAGSDQTDDRGMYRVYGLPPGDYVVASVPRVNLADIMQMVQNVADSLGVNPNGGAGGRGGGAGGNGVNALASILGGVAQGGRGGAGGGAGGPGGGLGGGRGAQALTDFLNPTSGTDQPEGYAPVYYPGTTVSASATTVAIGVAEERGGIDFQLELVPTASVAGTVTSPDGSVQGISLTLVNEQDSTPGGNLNNARVGADGKFKFTNIPPGQYSVVARGMPAGGRGGRGGQFGGAGGGGRGGGATVQQQDILWGSTPVAVDGHNVDNVAITMQPGMTVSGKVTLEGTATATAAAAPAGGTQTSPLSRVRVTLQSTDTSSQGPGFGGPMASQVDTDGNFTITGVAPGHYMISAQGAPGFNSKSAMAMGRDALDFPMEVKPSENVAGVAVTLSDKSTQITGTLQDPSGNPTSDYTIIVFASDNRYWLPNARRIKSTRPGTSGTYTISNLPPGDYRLAAVTDVEPGEWFDPAFLDQLRVASTSITLGEGEKKTQDLRLGGGGL
jgi:hypothetical protein